MATPQGKGAMVLGVLRQSVLFANFPEPVLEKLVEVGETRILNRGDTLFEQDAPGDSLAVLLAGKLKIVRTGTEGSRDSVLNFLGPGDLAGEIACLDGGPRTASAVMLARGAAFLVRRDDLLPVLATAPDALLEVVEVLCEKLRATSEIVETHQRQMSARFASGLLRLIEQRGRNTANGIELDLGANQEELGSYLGLSRANTSREIARLARAEILTQQNRRLVIGDTASLEEMAAQSDE